MWLINVSNIKAYKCEQCPRSFGHTNSLKLHVDGVHKKVKPYKCSQCDFACVQKQQLNAHITQIHNKVCKLKMDPTCVEFYVIFMKDYLGIFYITICSPSPPHSKVTTFLDFFFLPKMFRIKENRYPIFFFNFNISKLCCRL